METLSGQFSNFKPATPPTWSHQVERWSQLDDTCFTFCEAIAEWNFLKNFEKPDFIFLVLPNASNFSDFDFASTETSSPAKFVYTLPNICASIIFQMLKMDGKVICISKGKESLSFALGEAKEFNKNNKSVWIFSNSTDLSTTKRSVEFFELKP